MSTSIQREQGVAPEDVLSLVERAVAYFAADMAKTKEADAVRDRERDEQARSAFANALAVSLGLAVAPPVVAIDDHGYCRVTIDGLTFSYRRVNEYRSADEYDFTRVVVLRTCDKGCGVELWMNADNLYFLGESMSSSAFRHQWDCRNERPPSVSPEQRAIDAVPDAAEAYGQAVRTIMELEDERPLIKAKAIGEMIGTPNPLGKPGAVHSASSAEAIVEENALYWEHRIKQANAEVARWRADGALFAAKQRAWLLVNAVRAGDNE